MEELRYVPVPKYSKEFVLKELESGDTRRIIEALLSISYDVDENWQFVQDLMIQYSDHSEKGIRYMAMLCFGNICRYHRTIDKGKVLPILENGLKDNDACVRDGAEIALEDIERFYEHP